MFLTDKLASYAAAKRKLLPGVEHRQHKRLNNRAENSHQPTRQRERTGRCDGSNHQAKPNASSPPSVPFPRIFDHDGIPFKLRTIDRK